MHNLFYIKFYNKIPHKSTKWMGILAPFYTKDHRVVRASIIVQEEYLVFVENVFVCTEKREQDWEK